MQAYIRLGLQVIISLHHLLIAYSRPSHLLSFLPRITQHYIVLVVTTMGNNQPVTYLA